MKNNKDIELQDIIHTIESKKNKCFFIGFLSGILPYLMLLYIVSSYSGNLPITFKLTIAIMGIITSVISSIYVRNKSYNKMIIIFKNKYNLDYNKVVKLINSSH